MNHLLKLENVDLTAFSRIESFKWYDYWTENEPVACTVDIHIDHFQFLIQQLLHKDSAIKFLVAGQGGFFDDYKSAQKIHSVPQGGWSCSKTFTPLKHK